MSGKGSNSHSVKSILRGMAVWFIALMILTLISSTVVVQTELREKTIVYISSSLLFLSAAAAGNSLTGRKEKLLVCLILSLFLIIAALSLGFLLDGSRLESGGVLNTACFIMCGAFIGFVIELPKKKRSRIKL